MHSIESEGGCGRGSAENDVQGARVRTDTGRERESGESRRGGGVDWPLSNVGVNDMCLHVKVWRCEMM